MDFLWRGHFIQNIRKLASAGIIYENWGISTQRRGEEILDDEGLFVVSPIHSNGCKGTCSVIPFDNLELLDDERIDQSEC